MDRPPRVRYDATAIARYRPSPGCEGPVHAPIYPQGTDDGTRPQGAGRPGRRGRPPLRVAHRLRTRPRGPVVTRPRRSSAWPSATSRVGSCMPEEFSGGEAPGQANFVLRELGFTVEAKGSGSSSEEAEDALGRGQAWSREEVDLIVADYFTMLRAELAGEPYSKADHNRALRPSWAAARRVRSSSSTRTSAPSWSAWACRTSRATSPPGTTRRRSCPRPSRTT